MAMVSLVPVYLDMQEVTARLRLMNASLILAEIRANVLIWLMASIAFVMIAFQVRKKCAKKELLIS
jgi:hypothetical protein